MKWTWPQQHPLNYQLKSEMDNYLTNSSQIHTWSFDAHQSNLLLGFNLTDHRDLEPILVKLPDVLAQNLAQFELASMQAEHDIKSEKILTDQDLISAQNKDQGSSGEPLADQNLSEMYSKGEINKKESPAVEILKHFEHLDDPRVDTSRHKLMDIVTIAILAVICGANHWNQIESFGNEKHEWLSTFLELPFGIPSHDTFNRVFARLDPNQFRAGFISWVNSIRKAIPGEIIAI